MEADPGNSNERPFRLFSTKSGPPSQSPSRRSPLSDPTSIYYHAGGTATVAFSDLGLSQWATSTCRELGMRCPTDVQRCCIPRILSGFNVTAVALTGSGKTAAFALPILHRLAENPFGVYALVLTPTRELACQLAEQFRALGSSLNVRCTVVVGGMDMTGQARVLAQRPHIVVATPGRIKVLLENDLDLPAVFSKTKFLVLDEADRVLDAGFAEELKVIYQCLPRDRQTLLFSATLTDDMEAFHEISGDRSYFHKGYEGFNTVDSLNQHFIVTPKNVKEVYLAYLLSKMKEKSIRSVIVFVSTCRSCHLLNLLLEELELSVVALHSYKSQSLRLAALSRFKSGQIPILLATDVASRGLDIPTVDLVINYDIPRFPRDYVHRVGRTARAGRGGISISFVTQNDERLVKVIEDEIGKKLDAYECKENEVLEDITKVFNARRVARMKMIDDEFEEKVQARKEQKKKRKLLGS
ncbi:putative RNA helicase [Dioscorea sansibarensis]